METLQGIIDHIEGANDTSSPDDLRDRGSPDQPAHSSRTTKPPCKKLRGPNASDYTGGYSVPCPKTSGGAAVGKSIILPASFGGSPRAMHQSYLDAMAIVARFGKPDYFITMTANPNWDEVQRNIRSLTMLHWCWRR